MVDVEAGSPKRAGIRWYELRQTVDGEPWEIFQEGTYTAPDNRHAWNASLIMDVRKPTHGYCSDMTAGYEWPNKSISNFHK